VAGGERQRRRRIRFPWALSRGLQADQCSGDASRCLLGRQGPRSGAERRVEAATAIGFASEGRSFWRSTFNTDGASGVKSSSTAPGVGNVELGENLSRPAGVCRRGPTVSGQRGGVPGRSATQHQAQCPRPQQAAVTVRVARRRSIPAASAAREQGTAANRPLATRA